MRSCGQPNGTMANGTTVSGMPSSSRSAASRSRQRMDAEPHRAQAEQFGLDQHVLDAGGAVLGPQLRPLGLAGVAAHDDGDGRRRQHPGVGVPLGDLRQRGAVAEHDELPRLLVAGRRRRHAGAEQPLRRSRRRPAGRCTRGCCAGSGPGRPCSPRGRRAKRRRRGYRPGGRAGRRRRARPERGTGGRPSQAARPASSPPPAAAAPARPARHGVPVRHCCRLLRRAAISSSCS